MIPQLVKKLSIFRRNYRGRNPVLDLILS